MCFLIDDEINGGHDMNDDDDDSDLLSQIEMKTRIDKLQNGTQDAKQLKIPNASLGTSSESPSAAQKNAIKGENESDVLQFPLGVRIKKEVLDPREDDDGGSEDDEEEMESDNISTKQRKPTKRPSTGQRPNVIPKLPRAVSNRPKTNDENMEILKKVVTEIPDVGQIWKVVRTRILSQCQIWDLLMDKVRTKT